LSVRKSERVIVIEAQAKRKRITNHHRDANQNNPLTETAPPILAAGGYRYASRMELLPYTVNKRESQTKRLKKKKEIFERNRLS
jgi:hypothetical protein